MKLLKLIGAGLLFATVTGAHAADAVSVVTPRGAKIAVIAEKPAGAGPFPAVVLGSGSGYDQRQPLLEKTAQALVAQGIAVYRFDWAYQVAGTKFAAQPKDRKAEIEDMNTVLALARRDSTIDSKRIAVAGKSLGSIIAWRVFRATPELKGVLLLTPVCSRAESPDVSAVSYPDLTQETRPVGWLLGDTDPACPTATLYRYVGAADKPARIAAIGGDHALEVAGADATRNTKNIALAAQIAADYFAALLVHGKP